MDMDLVFLGINDVGFRIYEWLCDRDEVDVLALLTESDQLEEIDRLGPDVVLSVGFDHLVPSHILNVPSEGVLNLHSSLLPYNRGKSPNVWPIIDETPVGVTLHYMDEQFDTGDIIAQRTVETDFADTAKDIHQRLETAQFELFTDIWPDIVSGNIETTPQNPNAGTYHTKQDFLELCKLDPGEEVRVEEFLHRLRALTFPPFDNAEIEIDGRNYYLDISIRPADDDREADPEGLLESY
jgi:methionyl-tRNA formyltransferase